MSSAENEGKDKRFLTMSAIATPSMANHTGVLHGGDLLSMLDKAAYACAVRYSGHYVVTVSVDSVRFEKPIHIGSLIVCKAKITYIGKSSMEVMIDVSAENLKTGEATHTNTCFFTMVAIDENKRPIKNLKPLSIETDEDKAQYEAALVRRKLRLAMSS